MNVIISLAERARKIGNPDLRDTAAFALDEVHSWRCGLFASMDECNAVHEVWVPMEFVDGDWVGQTTAHRYLQPFSSFSAHYIVQPVVRWVQTLQDFDDDDDADVVRWRFHKDFLRPWRFAPKPRNEFRWIARFAAARTWYSADMFIADYVARSVPRLKHGYGTPSFFACCEQGEDIGRACYEYSLDVLGELAQAVVDDFDGTSMDVFMEALVEAVTLGMLWD